MLIVQKYKQCDKKWDRSAEKGKNDRQTTVGDQLMTLLIGAHSERRQL